MILESGFKEFFKEYLSAGEKLVCINGNRSNNLVISNEGSYSMTGGMRVRSGGGERVEAQSRAGE
ncbi:hypothetical protein J6590_098718 [Homalodisca vitripennis]|nr:hypothetical protein J6590_098718 [Homalodisca vitripennis]